MIIKHELLNFNTENCYFEYKIEEYLLVKYLKGAYRNNKPRFEKRFIEFFRPYLTAYELEYFNDTLDNFIIIWDAVEPFSYAEAFEIQNVSFKSKVFSSIDIREMIDNLGAKRIKVEGQELINKVWNEYTKSFDLIPYHAIYELYHVNGEKLGVESENLPIIKCWCTTTNEEHWLWVDNNNFDGISPLDAIASTCIIYESMKGKIQHIIRQGDVFLFEMKENVTPGENEKLIRLPKEEYFNLLKSQA